MTIKILFISMASHLAMFVLCRIVFAPARKPYPGFANFIDKWSQCDFCFTNFGVILEYLESSITTKKAIFRPSSTWSLPWVPETFLARFPVSVKKTCRPSANTETSRRTLEKPVVPRVRGPGMYTLS